MTKVITKKLNKNRKRPVKLPNILKKSGLFGNYRVSRFQNHHLFLDPPVYGDFKAILKNKIVVFWRYGPC